MADEQTNEVFVDAVRRIESACKAFVELDSTGPPLLGASYLVVGALMRSLGIPHFLAASAMDHPREMTDALRLKIHKAFGAPGTWGSGTPLGCALADLYQA